MTLSRPFNTVVVLTCLSGITLSAESYHPAIETSLRQFPSGSLDRVPSSSAPGSAPMRIDTTERITLDTSSSFEFETFVPVTTPSGTFLPLPPKLDLQQTPRFNPAKQVLEFDVKLGDATFSSIEELNAAITKLPKGTQITWAPGCDRTDGEPLHTHWKEFKSICDKQGIILVVTPSG